MTARAATAAAELRTPTARCSVAPSLAAGIRRAARAAATTRSDGSWLVLDLQQRLTAVRQIPLVERGGRVTCAVRVKLDADAREEPTVFALRQRGTEVSRRGVQHTV